jgi:endonuclease V-like protein UPF0215 family
MRGRLSHVVGFDDAPFERSRRGEVMIIGAVYAGTHLEGVLRGWVRRDGANSTRTLIGLVQRSRFRAHLQAILLQGIALAGFNVVDLRQLHETLGLPVIVIARKAPDLVAIRQALLTRVAGGRRKWRLIEQAGPMEPLAGVFVQRAGIAPEKARELIERLAVHGRIPEPLRVAHLIAGGVTTGESRHRV